MIIDIHSHLNFPDFDIDRLSILEEMKEQNVATITVGTSFETSKQAVELAQSTNILAATVGVHPTEDELFDSSEFTQLIDENVVAVGECGIDYFRGDEKADFQMKNFISHIEFAIDNKLPLMVHARSTKGTSDAYQVVADVIERYVHDWPSDVPKGDMHFFAGNIESARRLLNLGFTLSFDGPITFTRDYDEVIEFCPIDMIHAETDAPFAAPAPFRGKRCTPLMVNHVINRISEIKSLDRTVLDAQLVLNAYQTFPKLHNVLENALR